MVAPPGVACSASHSAKLPASNPPRQVTAADAGSADARTAIATRPTTRSDERRRRLWQPRSPTDTAPSPKLVSTVTYSKPFVKKPQPALGAQGRDGRRVTPRRRRQPRVADGDLGLADAREPRGAEHAGVDEGAEP